MACSRGKVFAIRSPETAARKTADASKLWAWFQCVVKPNRRVNRCLRVYDLASFNSKLSQDIKGMVKACGDFILAPRPECPPALPCCPRYALVSYAIHDTIVVYTVLYYIMLCGSI